MRLSSKSVRARLLIGASAAVLALSSGAAAMAQDREPISISPQSLTTALQQFGSQTATQVMFTPALVAAKKTGGVAAVADEQLAMAQLLQGTGLTFRREGNVYLIESADPQSASAAGDGAEGTVQALIVTAQKREENIQDVPIAMSAFTQEDLTRSQVAGGPDLMTQVPNFTFTKTNFSGYSIQIRGIGTQAISATTDAAVAVAENNTPFIRNRFFEQEFYDLQRVEVLRGPQGTLYGRNATAGVVNIITAKPTFHYEAKLSADVSNYNSSRLEGMVNVPLVDGRVALRLAGAWTKRDGYDTNQVTGSQIDGRDLWSTRLSLRFEPTDNVHANLIWEHFKEDDDRLRSGKQLCHTDEVTSVAGFTTTHYQTLTEYGQGGRWAGVQGTFSQGCKPASLYAPESFETPNGLSLPYIGPVALLAAPIAGGADSFIDPYLSNFQSRDLRVIESTVDPQYQAETDTVELQVAWDFADHLTFTSETGYNSDTLFSMEDYNRFATAPGVFANSVDGTSNTQRNDLVKDGVFCDPQIGCADRLVAIDVSTAKSRQFSQEFRVASNFEGPFNFSLGANFLRYDTEDKYYVFINTLTATAAMSTSANSFRTARGPLTDWQANVSDNYECMQNGLQPPNTSGGETVFGCFYIDPNPISSLNDMGHNYFLSKNPYKLISYALFGEAYYNITPQLKLTAGLRWTVDKKEAPRIPSWLLASETAGYPVAEVVRQEWREPTGRLALDWKPDLSFTDETLVYGSYGHGYKAGGMNPPPAGLVCTTLCDGANRGDFLGAATHPKTFGPEFVNAYELGTKNTLFDGKLTLNGDAFYYDYTGYQISQIVDRSAVNLNFDAKVWGAELEADWRPVENLRLGLKLGFEKTRVGDGMRAVDLMDRTAGDPNWVITRPFPTFPSNCVLPAWLYLGNTGFFGAANPELVNVGGKQGGNPGGCELAYVLGQDPATGADFVFDPYTQNPIASGFQFRQGVNYADWSTDLNDYPCWPNDPNTGQPVPITNGMAYPGVDPQCLAALANNGAGFYKQLGGNELPNAPHVTATLTADYTLPLPNSWLVTLHGDFYQQSEAWARIFNTPGYDKIKAYNNVNLAAIFTNEDAGWKVMAYVKNVFDKDNITGAFLNSDDSGLTTNIFLNEPRLYGLRVTKEWTGQGWWTGASPNHTGPYPLTVEISGQVQRQDAPYAAPTAAFMSALPAEIQPRDLFNRDLDWGDGREVKLTYRPSGSPWSVMGDVRYGRTNSSTARLHAEKAGDPVCRWGGGFEIICQIETQKYGAEYAARFYRTPVEWSDASAKNHEEHTVVDFAVGRDVGLGNAFSHNTVSAGIRYADFQSATNSTTHALANIDLPAGWMFKYPETHHVYEQKLDTEREFKGAGPAVSWEASLPLMTTGDAGHVQLDWAVTGGALFGKQKTMQNGSQTERYYSGNPNYWPEPQSGPTIVTPLPAARTKSVTVPVVDLSLGLSYEIQRIKVGAGYRWERYFNAIDGGYAERKAYDRTFDGPYFKVAVGFGG